MFRYLTILNPGESRNQRKKLPEMANIGVGAPSTRWKGNLMEFTWNIHKKAWWMRWKIRGREKPKKWQAPLYKGLWKFKWKYSKWKNPHSVLTYLVCIVQWLWNVPGWNLKIIGPTTSQNRVPLWGTDKKTVSYNFLFHLFPNFAPLLHGLKKYQD